MADGWIMDEFAFGDFVDCPACDGVGSLPEAEQGAIVAVNDCTRCSGTGVVPSDNATNPGASDE